MEGSKIAWTTHTFNPWMGCFKVSPGCTNCYAETLVRNRMGLRVWGPPSTTQRQRTTPAYWKQPLRWNKTAEASGVRARVFCASLADVFEDHPMVAPWRAELFALIEQCTALDWQLLTKRPENLRKFLPASWLAQPLPNVWLGTTVESQEQAYQRAGWLIETPAAVRFLSCEPLLGALDLRRMEIVKPEGMKPGVWLDALKGHVIGPDDLLDARIDWVIVGGESGPGARQFDLAWARSIVTQCRDADVPVFVKQMGSRPRVPREDALQFALMGEWTAESPGAPYGFAKPHDRAGADPSEWPEDLRVQEFPEVRRG
jgi:protein gp37